MQQADSGEWVLSMTATQDIKAGEAAWLCYCLQRGSHFLLHYGFTYSLTNLFTLLF